MFVTKIVTNKDRQIRRWLEDSEKKLGSEGIGITYEPAVQNLNWKRTHVKGGMGFVGQQISNIRV